MPAYPGEPTELQMTLEFKLATREVVRLEKKMPYITKDLCIERVCKFLISQGFSTPHSFKVSSYAYEMTRL